MDSSFVNQSAHQSACLMSHSLGPWLSGKIAQCNVRELLQCSLEPCRDYRLVKRWMTVDMSAEDVENGSDNTKLPFISSLRWVTVCIAPINSVNRTVEAGARNRFSLFVVVGCALKTTTHLTAVTHGSTPRQDTDVSVNMLYFHTLLVQPNIN